MTLSHSLIALHGFLGRPADWNLLTIDSIQTVDIFSLFAETGLWNWAEKFNFSRQNQSEKPILMGYSLGGRLALHALLHTPSLWQAGVIISAHPGLSNLLEKEKRLKRDQVWAKRFQTDKWETLMQAWNNQQVFAQSSFTFQRIESHYRRQELASVLQKWSLGRQDNLTQAISQLPMPILWIVGEKDPLHCSIAKTLTFAHPKSAVIVVPDAGHRVPWEQPFQFKNDLKQFLSLCQIDRLTSDVI